MWISTRRFAARPSGVALSAMGASRSRTLDEHLPWIDPATRQDVSHRFCAARFGVAALARNPGHGAAGPELANIGCMTPLRQDGAVPSHAVASDAAEDARWLPAGHAIVVALVLGAVAGTIAAFLSRLAQAEGLVTSL